MAARNLPKTVQELLDAMRNAYNKSETFTDKKTMAFSEATYLRLVAFLANYERETSEAQTALVEQTGSTMAKRAAFDRAVMFISHFFQTFNNGIARGVFPVNHRPFYRLDVNDNSVPIIYKETDLQTWAMNIKDGDANRITAGGKPMAMPTAAEVETEYQAYAAHRQAQTGLKDAYDKEQEDVSALYNQARLLVKDIWDEVEFYYRHDDHSSLRRKAREYGVVYLENHTNPETGEPVELLTGKVAPLTSVTIMERGFDANTLLIFFNKGTVPFKIYTAAKAGDVVPSSAVEVAPGLQKEVFVSELGGENNTFLMVYNESETVEGSWEVMVGE
jgi:hypothetical protein